MTYEPLHRLLSLLQDLFWSMVAPCSNLSDLTEWLPVVLLALTVLAITWTHLRHSHNKRVTHSVTAMVVCLAMIGPLLLFFPALFSEYRGYWHYYHPTAFESFLLQFVTTFLGCGNQRAIRIDNVTDCSQAIVGWTTDTWIAFLLIRWRSLSIPQRIAWICLFLTPWVIIELLPNSPLGYYIG